jgi:hypothetical protein
MSALNEPNYIRLKTEFLNRIEEAITNNKAVPLARFAGKDEINSHLDIIKGWEQCRDIVKNLCTQIEGEDNPSAGPIVSSSEPVVIEGEIVQ